MTSFEKRKGKNLSNEKARKPSARVKNPCKICSETVNIKTGLQCKGACKKWAHFDCLKFSAKQVDDIQSGLLKISCPCPDCEKDSKINQSQLFKNGKFRSRYNDCDTTFCPGIPQQTKIKTLCNLDAFNQTSKPLSYGITEGTSYEYFIRKETKQYDDKNVEEEDEYEEQVDEDTEEEDEDEEKSDIEGPERKFQTVLLAQSSTQLISPVCCTNSRSSPGTEGNIANRQTTAKPVGGCCRSGTCSTSSSSSGKKTSSPNGKDKKVKEKKPKENKPKEKKVTENKVKEKTPKEKKPKEKKPKENKGKEEKKTTNKGKKDKSPCCRSLSTCCKSDNVSLGSKQSAESSTSTSSTKSLKSTRSTQAPCGHAMQFCPGMKASSPTKLMKSDGVHSDNRQQPGDDRYNSPRAHMPTQRLPLSPYSGGKYADCPPPNPYCPPMPRSTPQQQQIQYPIPPPYGTLMTTCRPGCQGMKPASRGPPDYPGPGSERGQLKVVHNKEFSSKGFGQGGLYLPECYDPNRARTDAISNISSTQLLSLSPSNRSKSFCTLDTSNKKEGINISTEISAHRVKINKSDTKIWHQQQMNKYNRKMLLLALERMCQAMGQFSVQFRELTNKMTEKMDTKR